MAYRRTTAVLAQQADARARVVAAAHALVAEGGWGACSVSAVASGAGLATGSVYAHFAAKQDLLAEVFRQAASREVAAFREAAESAGQECPCQGLVAAVRAFAERAARAPRLAYALLAEPVDVAAVDAERLAFRAAYADLLAVHLRGLVPDPGVTASALIGAASEVLLLPLARGTFDEPAYARTVDALVAHALRSLGGTHEHHP